MVMISWLFRRSTPSRVDRLFRRLQLFSSSLYSLGHGGNDAQKTMGIIWLLLIANGITTEDRLPTWVVMSCFLAIGLGTAFGGWRIVKTMGQRITKLKPVGGFAAETGGAITLFLATYFGIPVSTTHTITGAIVGVGTTSGTRAVRWAVAGNIVSPDLLASLEYGAKFLGAPLIMVLGHSGCGAVDAAIKVLKAKTVLPGHLPALVREIKPAVIVAEKAKSGNLLDNAVAENVRRQVTRLKTSPPIVQKLYRDKMIDIVGGVYDLATGKIALV